MSSTSSSSSSSSSSFSSSPSSPSSVFIYHAVPVPLVGSMLYPLNQLKTVYPESYAQQVKKYAGRESIMEETIPILNCRWNDVLHFSSVHPQIIFTEMSLAARAAGADADQIPARRWFAVPYSAVQTSPHVYFENHPAAQRADGKHLSSDFKLCRESELARPREFPEEMRKYYVESFRNGQRPLLFNWLPHVLVKAPLEITAFKVFDWR